MLSKKNINDRLTSVIFVSFKQNVRKCCLLEHTTYISAHPWSPIISMAFTYSPALMYISAAALGSLLLLAQSACLVINIFLSNGSPDPINSCKPTKYQSMFITRSLVEKLLESRFHKYT